MFLQNFTKLKKKQWEIIIKTFSRPLIKDRHCIETWAREWTGSWEQTGGPESL